MIALLPLSGKKFQNFKSWPTDYICLGRFEESAVIKKDLFALPITTLIFLGIALKAAHDSSLFALCASSLGLSLSACSCLISAACNHGAGRRVILTLLRGACRSKHSLIRVFIKSTISFGDSTA